MARKKIYRRGAKKAASAHTCSILKKRLKSASNKRTRGKALGAFAKAGCAARARRRNRK